jgi:hypothetical protein
LDFFFWGPDAMAGRGCRLRWLIVVLLSALVGCSGPGPVPPLAGVGAAPVVPTPDAATMRVLYSGHSLMDQPLPDQVEQLAGATRIVLDWERQYRVGSLLRERTVGLDPAAATWTGWTLGQNRRGEGLDVAAALAGTLPGRSPFDVLVTTERHDILWAMMNEGSATYLRRQHDERERGRPGGATWFYEGWQSFGRGQVDLWIAYERASAGAWQCVAAEVNRSLAEAGRADRVWSLPASRALVLLVERALSPPGVAGVTAATPEQTLAALFRDEVHLTDLGMHYMALVSWAFLTGRPEPAPWRPDGVSPEQAASLRAVALQAYAELRTQTLVQAPAQDCRSQLTALCPVYWAYMEQRQLSDGRSRWAAGFDRAKQQWRCGGSIRDGGYQVRASTG